MVSKLHIINSSETGELHQVNCTVTIIIIIIATLEVVLDDIVYSYTLFSRPFSSQFHCHLTAGLTVTEYHCQ